MNIIIQLTILFSISFISEVISSLIPFTFPSSVLAMIILFILLVTKLLKLNQIETVATFLQKNMAMFFLPPVLALTEEYVYIKDIIFPILTISFISFFITFFMTYSSVIIVTKIQERYKKND